MRLFIRENNKDSDEIKLKIQHKRNNLRSRLNRWLQLQPSFVPPAALYHRTVNGLQGSENLEDDWAGLIDDAPERVSLLLP